MERYVKPILELPKNAFGYGYILGPDSYGHLKHNLHYSPAQELTNNIIFPKNTCNDCKKEIVQFEYGKETAIYLIKKTG